MSGSQAKHWLFTLNNPTGPLELESIDDLQYGVYQEEIGENGTRHFQGYLIFSVRKRLTQLKAIQQLSRAHFEARRGTSKQARDYCMKEETRVADTIPIEYGIFEEQITQGRDLGQG